MFFRNLSTDLLGFTAPQYEQIEMALSFGYRSIDLDLVDFHQQVETRGMDKARRLIDSAGVQVGTFGLPLDLEAEDAAFAAQLEQLDARSGMAAQLGCTRSLLTVSPVSESRPLHENFEFHNQRLSQAAQILDGHGVSLGVGFTASRSSGGKTSEAFEFIRNFATLKQLVEMVARDNVGYIVDAWQLYAAGEDALAAIREVTPKLIAVQIGDAPSDKPREELNREDRLLPGGEGAIDLAAVLGVLGEVHYEGPITPSVHSAHSQGRRRDQIVRSVAEALDKVWVAAGLEPIYKAPQPEPEPEPEPPEAEPEAIEEEESETAAAT